MDALQVLARSTSNESIPKIASRTDPPFRYARQFSSSNKDRSRCITLTSMPDTLRLRICQKLDAADDEVHKLTCFSKFFSFSISLENLIGSKYFHSILISSINSQSPAAGIVFLTFSKFPAFLADSFIFKSQIIKNP